MKGSTMGFAVYDGKEGNSTFGSQTWDLQDAFENSYEQYKVMARAPLASDKIHRNADMAFSENWHERQIERHMLVRMQKELRVQSATQKRKLLEQRKQERIRQHQEEGHDKNESAKFHPYSFSQAFKNGQRSVSVQQARTLQTGPPPTPVSSRPHTSTGVRGDHSSVYNRKSNSNMTVQNKLSGAFQEKQQLLHEQELLQKERSELGQEKAFRFRLRETEAGEIADQSGADKTNVDLWTIDPRNPKAVRAKSMKSIPSKCHRYVLISKPKIKLTLPLPSPLEEELLATRFPEQGEKVYKKYEGLLYKPPRRPLFGIEYTPFQSFHSN